MGCCCFCADSHECCLFAAMYITDPVSVKKCLSQSTVGLLRACIAVQLVDNYQSSALISAALYADSQ